MQKENKTLGLLSKGILVLWIISGMLVLLYLLVPSIAGAMAPGSMPAAASSGSHAAVSTAFAQLVALVQSVLSMLILLVLLPLTVISVAGMALSIIEIANAGNSGGWKALWIMLTIFFGGIGVLAYWYIGRKGLQ